LSGGTLSERVNSEAAERMKKGNQGRKRRKKPEDMTRSKSKEEGKDGDEEVQETRIKRPRQHAYFCPVEGCTAGWTRRRDLELHMATHDLPMFECVDCNKEYNREDNYKKHLRSPTHLKKTGQLVKKTSVGEFATASPTSPSVSSTTSLVSPLFDIAQPQALIPHQHISSESVSAEAEIHKLRAKIEALEGKVAQLENERSR